MKETVDNQGLLYSPGFKVKSSTKTSRATAEVQEGESGRLSLSVVTSLVSSFNL